MPVGVQPSNAVAVNPCRNSFTQDICLPFLREAQTPEGGWGYRPGGRNAVEPTCWALLALKAAPPSREFENSAGRACDWLLGSQLPDGSWPAQPGQQAGEQAGCWVTALACLALREHACASQAVAHGMEWLGKAWPREGGFVWRLRKRFRTAPNVVRGNFSLRGWSWTPGTASWVEPTSYALMLLRTIPSEHRSSRLASRLASGLEKRRQLGQAMLYDRMCPDGGWGCGSPLVYGVAAQPAIGPTVWALLALRENHNWPENQKSLGWLEEAYDHICGPGSLALAHLCLRAYGRPTPPLEPALRDHFGKNQFLYNVSVVAWVAIALGAPQSWWHAGKELGL